MLQRALVILVISAASATSVAHASDWGNDGSGGYPPPQHGYVYDLAPPVYGGPYDCPPRDWAPPVRWAPPPYRYRWAPPHRYWYPAYGYRGYGYQSEYRNDWDRHGAYRGGHSDDLRDHDDYPWHGH